MLACFFLTGSFAFKLQMKTSFFSQAFEGALIFPVLSQTLAYPVIPKSHEGLSSGVSHFNISFSLRRSVNSFKVRECDQDVNKISSSWIGLLAFWAKGCYEFWHLFLTIFFPQIQVSFLPQEWRHFRGSIIYDIIFVLVVFNS